MALKITNHETDGIAVLALDGRIVLGEETVALREKVKSLLAEGKKKIVLDLKNVSMIDSSGLGAFISCLRKLNAKSGDLKLCGMSKQVRAVFELVRMHRVFDILGTKEDAVRAFERVPASRLDRS